METSEKIYFNYHTYKPWNAKWFLGYTGIKLHGTSGKARGLTLESPNGSLAQVNESYVKFMFSL